MNITKIAVKRLIKRKSLSNIFESKMTFVAKPIIGKIKTRLRILDPIIFPITIFPFFLFKAENEAANSGKLVPIATRVSPITVLDTPKAIARFFPPLTVSSDPERRINRLKRIKKMFFPIPSSSGLFSLVDFCLRRWSMKRIKKQTNKNESLLEIEKSKMTYPEIKTDKISKNISLKLISSTDLERKKQLNPKIRPILAMFEPIEFPTANSGESLRIEEILTNTSGIDVPKATTVIPRNISFNFNFVPSFAVLETKYSAPRTNKPKPEIKIKKFINIFYKLAFLTYLQYSQFGLGSGISSEFKTSNISFTVRSIQ